MDVSVLAAVGSFVVSERVLRPKATILVILGCVLCYDLTTKTQDPASLRVYRGPALMAFTLMCCAYSLRTWRRNGVACDELLFWPGTPHAERHVSDSSESTVSSTSNKRGGRTSNGSGPNIIVLKPSSVVASEGDAAAGFGLLQQHTNHHGAARTRHLSLEHHDEIAPFLTSGAMDNDRSVASGPMSFSEHSDSRGSSSLDAPPAAAVEMLAVAIRNTKSADDAENLDEEKDLVSWDGHDADADDEENNYIEEEEGNITQTLLCQKRSTVRCLEIESPRNDTDSTDPFSGTNEFHDDNHHEGETHNIGVAATRNNADPSPTSQTLRRRRRPIRRLGTFFFFRSTSAGPDDSPYAPSGPSVFGAALDLSMPILFNFHLFIEAKNHPSILGGDMPAKILPLIFLSVLIVRSFIPPSRRMRFWSTVKFLPMAPFHPVSFRDAFMGDVITSLVRPLQDIFFALFYYATVIYGTVVGSYGMAEASRKLEGSWLLHNVVLPSCALLPLWWKFLQTLRQSYDSGQRWPYLGDAFKYLTAALVIVYGMAHPEDRRGKWWILSFVLTTLYQIWWDTMMDWELLVITQETDNHQQRRHSEMPNSCCEISSFEPTSTILIPLQRHIVQPFLNICRKVVTDFPRYDQIDLRPQRLYKTKRFYWKIFVVNALLRFAWMLSFIPAYYLSSDTGEAVRTLSFGVNSYVGVAISVAEIVRRCLWGLLKVEVETIRLTNMDTGPSTSPEQAFSLEEEVVENNHRTKSSKSPSLTQYLPLWMDTLHKRQHDNARTASSALFAFDESFMKKIFFVELCLWAGAFVGFGFLSVLQ